TDAKLCRRQHREARLDLLKILRVETVRSALRLLPQDVALFALPCLRASNGRLRERQVGSRDRVRGIDLIFHAYFGATMIGILRCILLSKFQCDLPDGTGTSCLRDDRRTLTPACDANIQQDSCDRSKTDYIGNRLVRFIARPVRA